MAPIRDAADRFTGLVTATAQSRRLDPALVEKDYWAVEALRATRAPIAVSLAGATVEVWTVFKGGTSFSKAFGLIERFSEDVDLLVPLPITGPGGYSNNQRSAVLVAVTTAVGGVLAASAAGQTLGNPRATKAERSAAGSALSQSSRSRKE